MRLPIFQVDAFAERVFGGNPAAVVLLDRWLPDPILQAIAAENNLSETAFVLLGGPMHGLRWFTPTLEVNLCGHATLAAGCVVMEVWGDEGTVRFATLSGELRVAKNGPLYELDLPSLPPQGEVELPEVVAALGAPPLRLFGLREVHQRRYLMAEYADEDAVVALRPNIPALGALGTNVIATAPGREVDFVSRFFAPASGVDEDPVTGSAHCSLTPFWAARLGKTTLQARQRSRRGGALVCRLAGDRVVLGGGVATYLRGEIEVPEG